jgi:ankyrin repeat protein
LKGGDVNQENKAGNTPLHDAISHDNRIMTKILLSNGAKPLIPNQYVFTPIRSTNAGQQRRDGRALLLHQFRGRDRRYYGEEVQQHHRQTSTTRHRAQGAGTRLAAALYVAVGLAPYSICLAGVVHLSVDKEQHEKTLHTKDRILLEAIFTNCIKKGHSDMVTVLLREPININTTDFNGWTPLHYAAMQGTDLRPIMN